MWLLNTDSLELRHFPDKTVVQKYAILSHTWGDEEVTFQDWEYREDILHMKGYAKILSACSLAEDDNLHLLWVDTICIDKSSSSELSEAINSMFKWYSDAALCYMYLDDVKDSNDIAGEFVGQLNNLNNTLYSPDGGSQGVDYRVMALTKSIRKSRWFTRGWTLQELIAPRCICFLTQDWQRLDRVKRKERIHGNGQYGKDDQESLLQIISDITRIRLPVLLSPEARMSCSVGERMSWVSNRQTTRIEDMAYCLLGIFEVNIPLLYGEGTRAFPRLQEEISRTTTDHSLFAWQWPRARAHESGGSPPILAYYAPAERYSNIFAISPRLFHQFDAEKWVPTALAEADLNPLEMVTTLTNFGMSTALEVIPTASPTFVLGALMLGGDNLRKPINNFQREVWCIPLQKSGQLYQRTPFPPGPFPLQTHRQRTVQQIHISRDISNSLVPREISDTLFRRDFQYAFLILFPDMRLDNGYSIQSSKKIGNVVLSLHRSAVAISPNTLRTGLASGAFLRIGRSEEHCAFGLYMAARENSNKTVELAVKLFPSATKWRSVRDSKVDFMPPIYSWNECGPWSLVVSKGHPVSPLPGEEPTPRMIFTVSIYETENADGTALSQG